MKCLWSFYNLSHVNCNIYSEPGTMNFMYNLPFFIVFGFIEGVYLSIVLNKVPQRGWVPSAILNVPLKIIYSWNYGRKIKYECKKKRKLSIEDLYALVTIIGSCSPRVYFLCSDLIYGFSQILRHYIKNMDSLHEIIIILIIRVILVTIVFRGEVSCGETWA